MSGPQPLPHNREAEEAIVGGLLCDGGRFKEVAAIVRPEHFYVDPVATIYTAMGEMDRQDIPIDIITVQEHLKSSDRFHKLRFLGGPVYLAELANRIVTTENLSQYARIVTEKAQLRQSIALGQEVLLKAREGRLEDVARTGQQIKQLARPPGQRRSRPAKAEPTPGLPAFERGDDLELAQVLLTELREVHGRVCYSEGDFFHYDDASGIWEAYDRDELERRLHAYAGAIVQRPNSAPRQLQITDGRVGGAIRRARAEVGDREFFYNAPVGVAFNNCFVRIEDAAIVAEPHDPDQRARARLPFAYKPQADCPRWRQFWVDVFAQDNDAEAKTSFLQEFVGACMFGIAPRFEKTPVFIGAKGANGKSRAIAVICALFLPTSITSISPHNFGKEYYRAKLRGSLLNVLTELPAREIMETESFKAVCSGDEIDGREPGERVFHFRPRCGLLFACNELPPISDPTGGPWRRLVPIEFNRSFEEDPQKDTLIAEKIIASEMEGVAAWAIEGVRRLLQDDGYTPSPSSDKRREEWRYTSDQVLQWVLDDLETDADGRLVLVPLRDEPHSGDYPLKSNELYALYRSWAREQGHSPLSAVRWVNRLQLLGAQKHRFNNGVRWNVTLRSNMQY